MQKGYTFETECDTESIAKLIKHLHSIHGQNGVTFQKLVEETVQQLVCLRLLTLYSRAEKFCDHHFLLLSDKVK